MKIILPGGSGQIGRLLAKAFTHDGHEVVVLSRHSYHAPWRVRLWDAETVGDWAVELNGADAVVNLAGHTVNCRYNETNRGLIMSSRIRSACAIGDAITHSSVPPRIWLQSSTATIYSHRFDAANDEMTGEIGGSELDAPAKWRFSIEVAQAWERMVDEAHVPKTRKVKMRSAMVMSPDQEGIFDTLARLACRGLGGANGNGCQYISWIHHVDFVQAIYWLLQHNNMEGPVNMAAPNPLPNAEFMRELRKSLDIPFGLPTSRGMLVIGAYLMGTETELILKSRRVFPARLLETGFQFQFPHWHEAAKDLSAGWRGHRSSVEQC